MREIEFETRLDNSRLSSILQQVAEYSRLRWDSFSSCAASLCPTLPAISMRNAQLKTSLRFGSEIIIKLHSFSGRLFFLYKITYIVRQTLHSFRNA